MSLSVRNKCRKYKWKGLYIKNNTTWICEKCFGTEGSIQ